MVQQDFHTNIGLSIIHMFFNAVCFSTDQTLRRALTEHVTSTCLKEHATQHVKKVTGERRLVLSCSHNSSTLCFLLAGAVAPVGLGQGCIHKTSRTICILSCFSECDALVMALFVMLFCFILKEKKEQQERKQPL